MKPLKIQKEIETIDSEKEHNKVLFDLGILDDMEDWELYQKQERIIDSIKDDISIEEYFKLMGKEYIPHPIPEIYHNISRARIKNTSIPIEEIRKILNKNIS